jgi:carboxypeptidase C (cathepsin A)
MKKLYLFISILGFCSSSIFAQGRHIDVESSVITNHTANILGDRFQYSATTGTQPVWDEDGNPIATLFYTYYQRKDIDDIDQRPLIISFNGGPGSASVWMHLAYTGPRILKGLGKYSM